MNPIIPHKTCYACEQEFPLTDEHWHKTKRSKDGYTSACKPCAIRISREWRENNRERHRQQSKNYNDTHKEEISQKKRERYLIKRDEIRAKGREYYQSHKEQSLANGRRWLDNNREYANELARKRAANPENKAKRKVYYAQYRIENKERVSEKNRRWHQSLSAEKKRARRAARRAREIAAEGHVSELDIKLAYRSQHGKCWHCGAQVNDDYHADHLIPLARGGTNNPNNIVISCPPCNLSKGAKLPHEWIGRLF